MAFYANVCRIGDYVYEKRIIEADWTIIKHRPIPKLYFESDNINTPIKGFGGANLYCVTYDSLSDRAIQLKQQPDLIEKAYGNIGIEYEVIHENYYTKLDFDLLRIKVLAIDIETEVKDGFPNVSDPQEAIILISVYDFQKDSIQVFGLKDFDNKQDNVTYHLFKYEDELLKSFLLYVSQSGVDIYTGWNIKNFDLPYIFNRIKNVLGEDIPRQLSPYYCAYVKNKFDEQYNRLQPIVHIPGVSVLDYLELYKKFTYKNQESYKLDYIASIEIGKKKVDHSEFGSFAEFYTNNWQKFVEYNIQDTVLIKHLDDKLKLLDLAMTLAYDTRTNYEDVFMQTKMWDVYTYNFLQAQSIAIPPNTKKKKDQAYSGAYVKAPLSGRYDWVASFDLNSLYPHIFINYNISPETLLNGKDENISIEGIIDGTYRNEERDVSVAANGSRYSKKKIGMFAYFMKSMYEDRKMYKKKQLELMKEQEKNPLPEQEKLISKYNNFQMAKKISLNSAYGAIGNPHFRYYNIDIAEAITVSGQLAVRWIEDKMNKYMNKLLKTNKDYIIASDTDSIYLNLERIVNKIPDNVSKIDKIDSFLHKYIEPYIEKSYEELADITSAYSQSMKMKREVIANCGIWVAKKRYILNVLDSEGVRYKEPYLKVTGLESVRAVISAWFRDNMKKSYEYFVDNDNKGLLHFIENVKELMYTLDYSEIAYPRGVKGLDKYHDPEKIYSLRTPVHVKGSLLYNHYLKEFGLTSKYESIKNGDKIKYLYLRNPNPIHDTVISYLNVLPEEFGLRNYIDYDSHYEKCFKLPVTNIIDAIGWESSLAPSLSSFWK